MWRRVLGLLAALLVGGTLLGAACWTLEAQRISYDTTGQYKDHQALADSVVRYAAAFLHCATWLDEWAIYVVFEELPDNAAGRAEPSVAYKEGVLRFDLEKIDGLPIWKLRQIIRHEIFHFYTSPLGGFAWRLATTPTEQQEATIKTEELTERLARLSVWDLFDSSLEALEAAGTNLCPSPGG